MKDEGAFNCDIKHLENLQVSLLGSVLVFYSALTAIYGAIYTVVMAVGGQSKEGMYYLLARASFNPPTFLKWILWIGIWAGLLFLYVAISINWRVVSLERIKGKLKRIVRAIKNKDVKLLLRELKPRVIPFIWCTPMAFFSFIVGCVFLLLRNPLNPLVK